MKSVILFRKDLQTEKEMKVASKYFEVYESRLFCGGSNVIGRYSALPFYEELERDLKENGCQLVNNFDQHKWIADMDWYVDLQAITPKTWRVSDFKEEETGPFVVKGRTNSRKHHWGNLMYAEDGHSAMMVAAYLNTDPQIRSQGIVIRKYVPLRTFAIADFGLPITNEWRFFCFRDRILTYGRYWDEVAEKYGVDPNDFELGEDGLDFVRRVANCACHHAEFYVVDIAERAEGGWILIEINDAQMSGLCGCAPDILYLELKEACDHFLKA